MSHFRSRPTQLELPLFDAPAAPAKVADAVRAERRLPFRVIEGGGQRRQESLVSRDAVVRILVETGADLLLRRISPERAEEIQNQVDRILDLFDRVDGRPELMPVLQRQLDELESLMTETRSKRRHHGR